MAQEPKTTADLADTFQEAATVPHASRLTHKEINRIYAAAAMERSQIVREAEQRKQQDRQPGMQF